MSRFLMLLALLAMVVMVACQPEDETDPREEFLEMVQKYDADGDSKLNAEELKRWLKDQEEAMGDPEQRMSDEEIDSTVRDLVLETDGNSDGAVSLEEIMVAGGDEPPQ
eukprot:Rhum_TRINITY_DN12798_c0_g1::Rhum_TRINITY_DN12798_c0_g1_i2::g.53759::m.53759